MGAQLGCFSCRCLYTLPRLAPPSHSSPEGLPGATAAALAAPCLARPSPQHTMGRHQASTPCVVPRETLVRQGITHSRPGVRAAFQMPAVRATRSAGAKVPSAGTKAPELPTPTYVSNRVEHGALYTPAPVRAWSGAYPPLGACSDVECQRTGAADKAALRVHEAGPAHWPQA